MTEQCSRFSVVLLGSGGVGKSSILHRYLHQRYSEIYTETVEETYVQSYNINGRYQQIYFIDTAGNIQFPAMRQIYISNAKGFILVYSVSNADSFAEMQKIWDQIKLVRTNVLIIPCVIAGNFLDNENKREVETFDALNWAYSENLGGCFLEVSAKEENGIKDIFDILLEQLGNTRAQQDGPFRIRSTSFTRKLEEENTNKRATQKRRIFGKTKQKSYDQVTSSNKSFQELAFEDYKEASIYRIISLQNVRSHSVDDPNKVSDKHRKTRCASFPTLQAIKIESSVYSTTARKNIGTNIVTSAVQRWKDLFSNQYTRKQKTGTNQT